MSNNTKKVKFSPHLTIILLRSNGETSEEQIKPEDEYKPEKYKRKKRKYPKTDLVLHPKTTQRHDLDCFSSFDSFLAQNSLFTKDDIQECLFLNEPSDMVTVSDTSSVLENDLDLNSVSPPVNDVVLPQQPLNVETMVQDDMPPLCPIIPTPTLPPLNNMTNIIPQPIEQITPNPKPNLPILPPIEINPPTPPPPPQQQPPKPAPKSKKRKPRKKCSVPECENICVQGGVCIKHGAKRKICNFEGCTKHQKRGGFCSAHGGSNNKRDRL